MALVVDVVALEVVVGALVGQVGVVGALVGAVGALVVVSSGQEICSFCNAMQIMPVVLAGQLNE